MIQTQNNKISYDTIRKNRTLSNFLETKEDEHESD